MFPARLKITVRLVMGAISVLATSAQAATITWNGDGDGTSWHDADNWDLNQVPTAGDDVIIPDVVPTTVVVFSTGTTAISSLDCDEPFQLSGGTLDIADTTAFNNTYTQIFGLLTGTGDVIVSGLTTWDGGKIEGTAGTETFTANGGMEMGPNSNTDLDNRIMDYSGTANWTNGQFRFFNGAVFNVGATDTFNALADGHVMFNNGTFNNAGTFVVNVPSSVDISTGTFSFLNTGTVDVQAGTLIFSNTSTHTAATITMANGTLLQFSAGTHDLDADTTLDATDVLFSGGVVNMGGTYTLSGSSTTVSGGIVNFTGGITGGVVGDLAITAGVANFSNTERSVTASSYTQSGGKLTGSSDVSVNSGPALWSGGEIEGTTGTETFTVNGGMEIGSISDKVLDHRILNYNGTANWTDGNILFFDGGVFNVGATDTFNALADDSLLFNDGTFNNAGTFVVNVANGILITTPSFSFLNTGTVDVQAGTLTVSSASYTQTAGATFLNGGDIETSTSLGLEGGELTGEGLITGNVVNGGGQINAGSSPGTIDIVGNLDHGQDGVFNAEIGGLLPGLEHDRVNVTDVFTVQGALNISLINSFDPQLGDSFVIMTFGSHVGDFGCKVTGFGIGGGLFFEVVFSDTELTLVVVDTILDCQPNGVLDECDISEGKSSDDNGNGIPDECELECSGPKECDDKVACTVDDCVDNTCVHTPDDSLCDDGVECTDDICDAVNDCQSSPNDGLCDDGVSCTDDTCDAVNDCQFAPNDDNCDNSQFCDGQETCDVSNDCQPGADPCTDPQFPICNEVDDVCEPEAECTDPGDCNDGNACTDDDCVDGECVSTPNTNPCNDGDACTTGEVCQDGACGGGGPTNCDDGNACTTDGCNSGSGCTHDDIVCNDGVDCTIDDCDPASGCTATPDDGACNDNNDCTTDTCDPVSGCEFTPDVGALCDDGDACTEDDTCDEDGNCGGTDLDCDDGDLCTIDGCADGECAHAEIECSEGEVCEEGNCVPQAECGSPEDCDDGDACTTDECVAEECVNTEIECPQGEVCVDGECQPQDDPCAPGPNGKVTICHIPPGNPDNAHTISVNPKAVSAHLAHGDYCGPCEEDDGSPLKESGGTGVSSSSPLFDEPQQAQPNGGRNTSCGFGAQFVGLMTSCLTLLRHGFGRQGVAIVMKEVRESLR